MSRQKKPAKLTPAGQARFGMIEARQRQCYWDALFFASQAFHYERLWHQHYYDESMKLAEKMRCFATPEEYQEEVNQQKANLSPWIGEAGVRLHIAPDLNTLRLCEKKEKALIQAIVAWSAAGADPAQLQEIVAAYRTEEGDKEVSP